jgi:hypothetical protein
MEHPTWEAGHRTLKEGLSGISSRPKHNSFNNLLRENTNLASPPRHLPLKREEFLLCSFRLIRFNHTAKQVAFRRPPHAQQAAHIPSRAPD